MDLGTLARSLLVEHDKLLQIFVQMLSVNFTNLVLENEGLYTLVASTTAGEGQDSISLDVQGKHVVSSDCLY